MFGGRRVEFWIIMDVAIRGASSCSSPFLVKSVLNIGNRYCLLVLVLLLSKEDFNDVLARRRDFLGTAIAIASNEGII